MRRSVRSDDFIVYFGNRSALFATTGWGWFNFAAYNGLHAAIMSSSGGLVTVSELST